MPSCPRWYGSPCFHPYDSFDGFILYHRGIIPLFLFFSAERSGMFKQVDQVRSNLVLHLETSVLHFVYSGTSDKEHSE